MRYERYYALFESLLYPTGGNLVFLQKEKKHFDMRS